MSKLNDFPMGVAVLDDHGRIRSLNSVAYDLFAPAIEAALGRHPESLIGIDVAALHREPTREAVSRLIDNRVAPDAKQGACTFLMPLNGSDRTLLARLTPLRGSGSDNGSSLVFFDVTEAPLRTNAVEPHDGGRLSARRLIKIPVQVGEGVGLIAVEDVVRLEGRGHYTRVLTTTDDYLSANALGELERRLDPALFMRVHRSHVVNVRRVSGLHRDGESLMLAFEGRDNERVPVSRTHASLVRKLFGLA